MNAICSRGDLLSKPEAGGCYDTKVTSDLYIYLYALCVYVNIQVTDYSMAMAMRAVVESGPTHQVHTH